MPVVSNLIIRNGGDFASWRGISNYVFINREFLEGIVKQFTQSDDSYLEQIYRGKTTFFVKQYELRIIIPSYCDGHYYYDKSIAMRESMFARFLSAIYRLDRKHSEKIVNLEGFIFRTKPGEKLPRYSISSLTAKFLYDCYTQ